MNRCVVHYEKPNIEAFNINNKVSPLTKIKDPEPKLKFIIINTTNLKRTEAEVPQKTIFAPRKHDVKASTLWY